MILHAALSPRRLRQLIRAGKIQFGGNRKLKIYGTLGCRSGKRMSAANRVFFESEGEAIMCGFRPCKKCMGTMRKNAVVADT